MGCAFAISPPVFESVDLHQKFLVVDFVINLRRLELSGVECYRVQALLLILLR